MVPAYHFFFFFVLIVVMNWEIAELDESCCFQLVQPNKQNSLQTTLKDRVRQLLLKEEEDLPTRLRIIDQLQSLGVAYHFEEEIKSILMRMHLEGAHHQLKDDLSSTALVFRMLRGHGLPASTGKDQKKTHPKSFLSFFPFPADGKTKSLTNWHRVYCPSLRRCFQCIQRRQGWFQSCQPKGRWWIHCPLRSFVPGLPRRGHAWQSKSIRHREPQRTDAVQGTWPEGKNWRRLARPSYALESSEAAGDLVAERERAPQQRRRRRRELLDWPLRSAAG